MNKNIPFSLEGRTALVTGSSRGIGASLALGFAEAGADIIVHYVQNSDAATAVCKKIQSLGRHARTVQGNLRDPSTVDHIAKQAIDAFGKVDILVHNASIQFRTDWRDITHEEALELFNINLFAVLQLTQQLTPAMIEQNWGRILMIGSVQQSVPHPEMALYAASKAAMENLTRNLAKQLAPSNITVNIIAPGVIDTDRNKLALGDNLYLQRVLEKIPANRIGTPEDCAGAARMLASEAGSYITGQTLFIDGGMSL